ncbi:MAG: shikimate kinase [Clostridia bacterium]|nr:shikimate kinase [Clostridia bacterium]
MNIVLCGMMGCGKTTVANEFARRGKTVVDTDAEIVKEYGSIDNIFKQYGEERFREIESEITRKIAREFDGAVISLGGGCVLRACNVEELKRTGWIFYLRTSAEVIIKRLKGDTTRPLLQGGLEEKVRGILSTRSAIYESVADHIVDTDNLTPEQVADIIGEAVK